MAKENFKIIFDTSKFSPYYFNPATTEGKYIVYLTSKYDFQISKDRADALQKILFPRTEKLDIANDVLSAFTAFKMYTMLVDALKGDTTYLDAQIKRFGNFFVDEGITENNYSWLDKLKGKNTKLPDVIEEYLGNTRKVSEFVEFGTSVENDTYEYFAGINSENYKDLPSVVVSNRIKKLINESERIRAEMPIEEFGIKVAENIEYLETQAEEAALLGKPISIPFKDLFEEMKYNTYLEISRCYKLSTEIRDEYKQKANFISDQNKVENVNATILNPLQYYDLVANYSLKKSDDK